MQVPYLCSLLSLLVAMTGAHSSYSLLDAVEKRTHGQKYCGKEINDALKMVCNSVYNTMFVANKRSSDVPSGTEFEDFPRKSSRAPDFIVMDTADFDKLVANVQTLRYPFASRSSALSVFPSYKNNGRQKRGIYDECCKNTCSISELTTYCAAK